MTITRNDALDRIKGLKVKQAREEMINILKESGSLVKQTAIIHNVKCAERSGAEMEILVSPQWFIKVLDKKDQILKKVTECNWRPSSMRIRMENWIAGLSWDWCISRQRFFGVPFPIWYSKRKGEEGKIIIAQKDQLPVDPAKDLPKGYESHEVDADMDVMDTWATSSISPQLSSLAISDQYAIDLDKHKKLFPFDLRPQAHEIIRTWAFTTIVKSLIHENSLPWKNIMISGWCLAKDKSKMSKSKGNVITPEKLIKEKGCDAVRYWTATSHLGTDTSYQEETIKTGYKLVTKLFNVAKFCAINIDDFSKCSNNAKKDIQENIIFEKSDLWIISKLSQTIKSCQDEFEKYNYASARERIEDFFWNDFCDNYLEIIKIRYYGQNAFKYKDKNLSQLQLAEIAKKRNSAVHSLCYCFEAILKLFAPFVPCITENLYQNLFTHKIKQGQSIHDCGTWPKLNDYLIDEQSLIIGQEMMIVILQARKYKSDNNISLATQINKMILPQNQQILQHAEEDLKNVTGVDIIEFNNDVGNALFVK